VTSPACRCLFVACLLTAAVTRTHAAGVEPEPRADAVWPQWRGPDNNGIARAKNLPTTWSADKNVAWKLPLPGKGSSTPVVWGNKIFLTAEEGDKILLLCIGTDGKQKWKRDLGGAFRSGRGDEGNCASPSPSTDGKHVYAFAGNGEFAAFDLDGKEVWRFNAQTRYGKFKIQFGIHSTPALFKDHLYFQLIHDNAGIVVCISAKDGKDVWKVERKSDGTDENRHSYASAFVWTNGKDAYLVCHGNDYATAHSLKDGEEIWRLGDLNPRTRYNRTLRFVASPVCTPDLIVVPSAKRGVIAAIKPDVKGKMMADSKQILWRKTSGTPDVPCPLVYDGLVYLCDENGNGLTVLDAKTGAKVAEHKIASGIHRASPVYADGKIYVLSRKGTATVVGAGKDGKVLATNELPDSTAASIVAVGNRIYVRGYKNLWAIEEKK
jgi:outer membrane protein assembly factor BamB